uniref:Uncharacterized protein n=1 Tax=Tetranychus urticae TaxID=32264 RepID=T1KQQ8_TETUR
MQQRLRKLLEAKGDGGKDLLINGIFKFH